MSVVNVCLTVKNRMYSTAGVVNQFECEHNHFTDCLRAIFVIIIQISKLLTIKLKPLLHEYTS